MKTHVLLYFRVRMVLHLALYKSCVGSLLAAQMVCTVSTQLFFFFYKKHTCTNITLSPGEFCLPHNARKTDVSTTRYISSADRGI